MTDISDTFFTSIGCMDGRIQSAVASFGKTRFGAKYPDTITEAGMVGILSHKPSKAILNGVKNKILISVKHHHSKGIVVHGHEQCAGNPVSDDQQIKDIIEAARVLKELEPGVDIVPVFIARKNNTWKIQELESASFKKTAHVLNLY
ncbi:MAG: hypothetical protein HY344_00820 [Candidatus Levybacteria bacterium]|nr:hypothetical protein [Candidatus Levybacteria bacterium]